MNFLLNVSTTSAMSRVPMSALLSWFSECRPAAEQNHSPSMKR